MTAHAILSPSAADRWATCPGSVYLSKDRVDESSEYADEGTVAHFLASECLEQEVDAAHFKGQSILVPKSGGASWLEEGWEPGNAAAAFEVDDDMAEEVQKYLTYVRQVSVGAELFVERTYTIACVPDCFGTSDATVLHADGELHVIDLKYGRGVEVSAVENKQMMLYALGAIDAFALTHDIQTVRMTVHQPRQNNVSEWSISLEDLLTAGGRFKTAGEFAMQFHNGRVPVADDFTPSESACRFCPARGNCEALANFCLTTLADDFVDLDIADKTLPVVVDAATERVGVLNNIQLGKLMQNIGLIEIWTKAVRAQVESELLLGRPVYGHKLVEGRKGKREWIDEKDVEETLKRMRMKKGEMYDFKVISPSTAEKLFKTSPRRWDRVRDHITQANGKPSVAPEADPRPALVIAPLEDFDDLTQTPATDVIDVSTLV